MKGFDSMLESKEFVIEFIMEAGYTELEANEIYTNDEYIIHDGDMTEIARRYVEDNYDLETMFDRKLGSLAYYITIDYEALGRDMRIEGSFYEHDTNNKILEILK